MSAADAGQMLHELREEAGASIADLAEASGFMPNWLKQLERGARTRASALTEVAEGLAALRDLDSAATAELVADVLAAADGDHKPEPPPGTPPSPRPRDPAKHRQAVADERGRERLREFEAYRAEHGDLDAVDRFFGDGEGSDDGR